MSMRKTTLAPGQFLRSVHMKKSYLGKAGYPVLSVTSVRPCAEASKFFVTGVKYMDPNLYFWFYSYRGGGGGQNV